MPTWLYALQITFFTGLYGFQHVMLNRRYRYMLDQLEKISDQALREASFQSFKILQLDARYKRFEMATNDQLRKLWEELPSIEL